MEFEFAWMKAAAHTIMVCWVMETSDQSEACAERYDPGPGGDWMDQVHEGDPALAPYWPMAYALAGRLYQVLTEHHAQHSPRSSLAHNLYHNDTSEEDWSDHAHRSVMVSFGHGTEPPEPVGGVEHPTEHTCEHTNPLPL